MSILRVLAPSYNESFSELFSLGRKLGSGQFGTTYECTCKKTNTPYACKVIPKVKLIHKQDVADVQMEVSIMYHMEGHENIVTIIGAYEDSLNVYIVMELCTGGELYDNILQGIEKRGFPYSEKDAAGIAKSVMRVVDACHSLGVIHRDLKPENFLLSSRGKDAILKATDFGLSSFFNPEKMQTRHCGSPMYMAPEVVRCRPSALGPLGLLKNQTMVGYGPEIDIWSAGVIIYALLCGFPPFYAKSHSSADIFKAILKGNPSFKLTPWPQISVEAKDLIKQMLDLDPAKRPTAKQVLQNPWFNQPGVANNEPLDPIVAVRLKQFSSMVKMRKVAMRVIAENLKEEEILGLKELFTSMDKDHSGQITFDELKEGLLSMGARLTDEELLKIMNETDVDQNGSIDYREFVAATMNLSKVEKHENLRKAFAFFDSDHSNFISIDELKNACGKFNISDAQVVQMMNDVDLNHDGKIDFREFERMMLKQVEGFGRRDISSFYSPDVHPEFN